MGDLKAETYFQFPLSLLAFGPDVKTRMATIIDHCAVTAGRAKCGTLSREDARKFAREWPPENHPFGLRLADFEHVEIAVGMRLLGIRGGNVDGIQENSLQAGDFLRLMDKEFGPAPFVRVRADLPNEVSTDRKSVV